MFVTAIGRNALPEAAKELIDTIVPEQRVGGLSNVDFSCECSDAAAAEVMYSTLKRLMERVNQWHSYVKGLTAHFTVTDSLGKSIELPARPGDHFKINIPGPRNKLGGGFDWITVTDKQERTHKNAVLFYFTAMPSANPQSVSQDVAHFLQKGASTTFIALKQDRVVRMLIKSRNEVPNVHTQNGKDQIRNRAVGLFAAVFFSQYQWTKLAKALLSLAKKGK